MNIYNRNVVIFVIFVILLITIILVKLNINEPFITFKNIEYSDKLTLYDIKNLNKGHDILSDVLRQFNRICRKYNLKYWCTGGTLIGVLRHKGWIPFDADVDVSMLDTDYNKFKTIIDSELPLTMKFTHLPTRRGSTKRPCSKIRDNRAHYIFTSWGKESLVNLDVQLDIFIFN